MRSADAIGIVRRHWPIAVLGIIAAAFIFTNLGLDYLWEDEGDTAALAVNILKFGVPKAWDGVSFLDSDKGARLNDDLVMVSHPWLQYYLTAGSFLIFGKSNLAARLPFAIAGWLTVLATYLCVYDLAANRWTAFCSATLLTSSVQFLLFCRQCRYYALSMLLGCLLVWIFFRLRSARAAVLYTIVAILLFHAHPFGIVLVGALGLTVFLSADFKAQRRFILWTSPIIALLTLPWIVLARAGYSENSDLVKSLPQFAGRLLQYAIECASVTPLVGVLILGLIHVMSSSAARQKDDTSFHSSQNAFWNRNRPGIFLVAVVTLACYAVATGLAESTDTLWHIGIRYTTAIMPIIAMAAAVLIVGVARGQLAIWLPLLGLLVLTRIGQLTPWIFWGQKVTTFDGKEVIEAHLPLAYLDKFFSLKQQLAFWDDLRTENPGTLTEVCQFLQSHAKSGDLVVTNYDWEPLYFYTQLPQALKVLPDYPVYQTARRKGLPEYVFNIDHVRWVIWRPVWDGNLGYFQQDVAHQILDQGAHAMRVAQFEETIWENRPEIHLHRFPGDNYFFTKPENHLPAEVFRIDWP